MSERRWRPHLACVAVILLLVCARLVVTQSSMVSDTAPECATLAENATADAAAVASATKQRDIQRRAKTFSTAMLQKQKRRQRRSSTGGTTYTVDSAKDLRGVRGPCANTSDAWFA